MKTEYGILFDNGAWTVIERQDGLPTFQVGACQSFEEAVMAIAGRTGGNVLIKTVTEE